MTEPSLTLVFMDRVVRHKMAMQTIEIEEEWLDENDMIVWDRLPGEIRGPVTQMRENAVPLVDSLLGALHSRLQ